MQPTRQLLPLTVLLVALTGCAQLTEQAAAPNTSAAGSAAGNPGGFDHCTPDGSTCYLTAEDLARWGGHDHDEIQPQQELDPVPAPQPEPLPESSTDLVI